MKSIKTVCLFLLILIIFTGCGENKPLNPNEPVIITLWHNYGGQMEETMNDLVDEFNASVGKEQGIIVNITSVSSSSALYDKIVASADGIPGSSELPNITTGYPKSAIILMNNDKLVDLKEYFSQDELDQYLPRFIEEGIINDKLAVFPTAKSTEVLFLNKTLFDRFSDAVGISIDSLSTFEGISEAAIKYYEWTDAQTPDIPNDGKAFYTSDSWFNVAQVGMNQLGDTFIVDKAVNYTDNYKRVWDPYIEAAAKGGFAIYNGYSSDLAKTGEIVCSTGSTAGILFYGNTITYKDNTKENVEYEILPYPVFKSGKKVALQRGGGMIVTKSTKEKEYASALFLKWFTAPEQNMKFISETGYLPVTRDAFEVSIEQYINKVDNINIKKLLKTAVTMYNEYDFYIPPVFDEFDSMEKTYTVRIKQAALDARTSYLSFLDREDAEEAFKHLTQNIYDALIE
ncbi:MAG: extracellular solute-binding protein [Clostridiaceae bacterium]|jgi:multiple sugar transport system substrate-binding protein|nr:extracellular solute-binding protein [Clostridiaceae bacterium]